MSFSMLMQQALSFGDSLPPLHFVASEVSHYIQVLICLGNILKVTPRL